MKRFARQFLGLKFAIAMLTAAVLFIAVVKRASWINGSWYWRWDWRDLSTLPAKRFYGAMLLAAVPMMIAWLLPDRARKAALVLIVLSVIAMKLTSVAILTQPMSFAALDAVVRSPSAMSYYTDANTIATGMPRGWLAMYPEILQAGGMHLHTLSKPPGAVAYFFAFIRAMPEKSAVVSGIVLTIVSSLSIVAIYLFVRDITGKHRAALVASSLLAVCPGFVLFVPSFDACYPIFGCALILAWHRAITGSGRWNTTLFAAIFVVMTFFTYNLLVLGAMLAAWTLVAPGRRDPRGLMLLILSTILQITAFSIVLWICTGYAPIATFRAAYHNQQALLAAHRADRPYPATIWFDLVDFALGAGWVIVPLVAFGIFHRVMRDRGYRDSESLLVLLCIAQIVLVAVLGILQSETARAWNFMLPLLILPASIELARWNRAMRISVYFAMLIVLLAIGHNMIFLRP